jgi:glycosyltransferase involved in cell wall biosynthesis
MVGRARYALPLSESLTRKFDALAEVFELRVLAGAARADANGDGIFHLIPPARVRALDAAAFYGTLVPRVASELRRFRPDAVVAQSPYEGLAVLAARRLTSSSAALVVEIHGDWHTWARLYGSPLRALAAPAADAVAPFAVRRADAVRTLSAFTEGLVRRAGAEPSASFTTFTDLGAFSEPPAVPLPDRPAALFVGVLERYKNVDGIVGAWRRAAPQVPGATLQIVGRGREQAQVEALVGELPEQTRWVPSLPTSGVVDALDDAWLLLLASRSEGTPRVVLEARCRGRAVVGARAGGIPDVVADEETRGRSRLRSSGCSPTGSWRRAWARPDGPASPNGSTRPTSTPAAWPSSSSTPSPSEADEHEAHRRHAEGRPGRSEPGRDRREASCARRAGR